MTTGLEMENSNNSNISQNMVSSSIQSLSNIVNQVTNPLPQSYDQKNKHRNYDAKYRYELVADANSNSNSKNSPNTGITGSKTQKVVCATDGMDGEFDEDIDSNSNNEEDTGSEEDEDEDMVWNPVNGLKPLGKK